MGLQKSELKRRVVHLITRYLQPKQIYQSIILKEWPYSVMYKKEYACRDRAMMAMAFVSAGRISEVVGGPMYKWDRTRKVATKTGKHHLGLQRENLRVSERHILVNCMSVVKRSQKLLKRYGSQLAIRDDFVIPLKRGLFDNPFWDQLIPFGWLVKEYLAKYAPDKGKLFPYEDTRAYQIIREVTGMFPNWFRAQAEHFYGHFLLTDTVKLAKFVKIVDPKHVKHYIGYSWTEQLKDKTISMDFEWIEKTVEEIKKENLAFYSQSTPYSTL